MSDIFGEWGPLGRRCFFGGGKNGRLCRPVLLWFCNECVKQYSQQLQRCRYSVVVRAMQIIVSLKAAELDLRPRCNVPVQDVVNCAVVLVRFVDSLFTGVALATRQCGLKRRQNNLPFAEPMPFVVMPFRLVEVACRHKVIDSSSTDPSALDRLLIESRKVFLEREGAVAEVRRVNRRHHN